jgi:hypothetical protein
MRGTPSNPTIEDYKQQAKTLRFELGSQLLTHSAALELVAKQHGHRDWNTLRAAIPESPVGYQINQRIAGTYLGQPFTGYIKAVQTVGTHGHHRLTLRFDTPVDVVQFDSFSALRQQVNCTVDHTGKSLQKTSDGSPHVVISA